MTYDIKISAPSNKRISNIKINGKAFDLNKTYKVSSWGGNVQRQGENLQEAKIKPVYNVVMDYIKKQKSVKASLKSNVNVLDYQSGCMLKG